MNIRILLLGLILFLGSYSYAQVVKVENGVSFSWSNYADRSNTHYIGGLGLEYLENRYLMLNTQLSFFERGETSTMTFFPENRLNVFINYVSVGTTIRLKLAGLNGNFFIGAGPSIDFKRKSEYRIEGEKNDWFGADEGEFLSSDLVLSALAECGYFADIKNWRIELSISYRNNLTKINTETRKGFISHLIACSVGLGYKF